MDLLGGHEPETHRIRSWSDIECNIQIIPDLQFQFFQGIDISSPFYDLYWYHQRTKSSIIRGITHHRDQVFLSLRLKATSAPFDDTILVYVFGANQVCKVLLYDDLPHPRMVMFGLEDLDQLLSAQPIRYRGGDVQWLDRCWKLEDFTQIPRPTRYPLVNFYSFRIDDDEYCITCICTHPFFVSFYQ